MPDTRIGKCPWCERHNQTLYLTTGVIYETGELWIEWVCAECRQACRKLKEVSGDG
jgi:hypothetical protein